MIFKNKVDRDFTLEYNLKQIFDKMFKYLPIY